MRVMFIFARSGWWWTTANITAFDPDDEECFLLLFLCFYLCLFFLELLTAWPLFIFFLFLFFDLLPSASGLKIVHHIFPRNSHRRVFMKKAVLKNVPIFTGKHLCWSLFSITLQVFRIRIWRLATEDYANILAVEQTYSVWFQKLFFW